MKKEKYSVYLGFKNYRGDVVEEEKIAEFYHPYRAEKYVEFCKQNTDDTYSYRIEEDKK